MTHGDGVSGPLFEYSENAPLTPSPGVIKLYHTSETEIQDPDIHFGRKNADFGWGFYLTPDREFTYRWARENAVVNEYEFNLTGLKVINLKRDKDWFEYIYNNRRFRDASDADVVIGPIANDTIFDTLGVLSSGVIEKDDALKLLMVGPEYTQYAIKTQRALDSLRFIRSEHIKRADEEILRQEQDDYYKQFSAEFEKTAGD